MSLSAGVIDCDVRSQCTFPVACQPDACWQVGRPPGLTAQARQGRGGGGAGIGVTMEGRNKQALARWERKTAGGGEQDLGLNHGTPSPPSPHSQTYLHAPPSEPPPAAPSDLLVSYFAKVSVRLRRSLGLKVCRRAFLTLPRPPHLL